VIHPNGDPSTSPRGDRIRSVFDGAGEPFGAVPGSRAPAGHVDGRAGFAQVLGDGRARAPARPGHDGDPSVEWFHPTSFLLGSAKLRN
jgi:hypothetical protein